MSLVDRWYEKRADEAWYERGAVCWAPCSFLLRETWGLRTLNPDPVAVESSTFTLKRLKRVGGREDSLFHHVPHHALGLRKNEENLVVTYKRRRVVILSKALDPAVTKEIGAYKKALRIEDAFLCAPIYTLRDEGGSPKFTPAFIENVRAFRYPNVFHLPADSSFGQREACVRFDRIQMVAKENLDHLRAWLTADATYLLDLWLEYYLTGSMDEFMKGCRDDLARALAASRAAARSAAPS